MVLDNYISMVLYMNYRLNRQSILFLQTASEHFHDHSQGGASLQICHQLR
jgi:hypothetical protein